MTLRLGTITSSYKTTPVELRERLALPEAEIAAAIQCIRAKTGALEVMILSTCNRVEIYFEAENPLALMDPVEDAYLDFKQAPELKGKAFTRLMGADAIRHIFRVSSSLESMVIGEPQITGQIKHFYQLSKEAGGTGFMINQIMERAFATAKRVRNETGIAKFAVSISFAATELAKKIFEDLGDKSILIIGAGEMAELAASHLLKAGCAQLMVTNRTFSRAVSLAEQYNGSAVRFEYMAQHLETADIIISSTGARGFVLTPELIQSSLKKRKNRPMFLIDIAVPRDIDPRINDLNNVYVYDIDDLQNVVDANRKEREKEAAQAQVIIDDEIAKTESWKATLEVVPTLKLLREKLTRLAELELSKGLSKLEGLSPKQEQQIQAMLRGLTNKILHQPTVMLKQVAQDQEKSLDYVQCLLDLFDLSEPTAANHTKSKVISLK